MAKKAWSDLNASQQLLICVGGAAEAVVTVAAIRDLARRRSSQIRGPKRLWMLSFVVQPLGPLAYFLIGRR
jgi:hypothetical protein